MKKIWIKSIIIILALILLQSLLIGVVKKDKKGKSDQFYYVDPVTAVREMGPGWNLGNTLDAIPIEGAWNNPIFEEHSFDRIKESGFTSVRIPVSWTHHIGPAPDYIVDPVWMDRVEEVVTWALKRDFWVVLNVHHDSWKWASVEDVKRREEVMEKLDIIWLQIAERFKDKSERLLFETLNEPHGGTEWGSSPEELADMAEQYNIINQRVLNVIRGSGGYNDKRLVLLPGLWTNINQTLLHFRTPDDDHIILTVHNYDPWDYVSNSWGRTDWGTEEERAYFDQLFGELYDAFVAEGLPVIIGEYGTLGSNELSSKWVYHDTFVRTAHKYGMATMWWDNGFDHYDRVHQVWRDPITKDIIINASYGIPNSLVDRAMIYIREGREVTDEQIQIELNGNHLEGISNEAGPLKEGIDYIVESSTVTLKGEYISSVLTHLGINDILTFTFTQGADQQVYIVQYATPIAAQTTFTVDLSQEQITEDLVIPVDFKGTTLATIKAMRINGVPVKDEWTADVMQEHQIGRLNAHNDFRFTEDSVIISAHNVLNILDQDSIFTLEFWPRTEQVNVEIQINVIKP